MSLIEIIIHFVDKEWLNKAKPRAKHYATQYKDINISLITLWPYAAWVCCHFETSWILCTKTIKHHELYNIMTAVVLFSGRNICSRTSLDHTGCSVAVSSGVFTQCLILIFASLQWKNLGAIVTPGKSVTTFVKTLRCAERFSKEKNSLM